MADDLNEQVDEVVEDAGYVTVPIDETLTRHGEAADAKAVGDALRSVQTGVTVDGQSKDANNDIKLLAEHIPYATGTSVKQKIDSVDSKTAENILMSDGQGAQTIAEAIDNAGAKSADQIPMETGSIETIADRIESIEQDIDGLSDSFDQYSEATDSAIEALQEEDTELTDEEVHEIVAEVFEGEDEEE